MSSTPPRSSRPMLAVFAVMLTALAIAALTSRGGGEARADTEAPAGDAPATGPPMTVTATGDIMMGTPQFGLPPDDARGFFDPVAGLLKGDIVMGNLEGTLSTTTGSKCGPDSSNCFAFQSPPAYAETLAAAGFTVMNLANNHANDFGDAGQQETVAALSAVGIQATGLAGTRAIVDAGGRSVAVLGFAPYPWADPLLELDVAAERVRSAAADADVPHGVEPTLRVDHTASGDDQIELRGRLCTGPDHKEQQCNSSHYFLHDVGDCICQRTRNMAIYCRPGACSRCQSKS